MPRVNFWFDPRTWYIGVAWDHFSVTVAILCVGFICDRHSEWDLPIDTTF